MTSTIRISTVLLAITVVGSLSSDARAQQPSDAAKLRFTNGFEAGIDSVTTLPELLHQENLFVMEVTFKPMRMRWVEVTDPKTGKKSRELVWYLVYKAVNRAVPRRQDTENVIPVNVEDAVPPPIFVPEFTLVTNDNGKQEIYHDTIFPAALADIQKREDHYKRQPKLKDNVAIVGPLPPAAPAAAAGATAKPAPEKAIYGVAIFRNVDPETDFFTVYMSGFSNGFRKQNGMTLRKTIVQKYQRPGDRFFQNEAEIKRDGDPQWVYWPDDAPAKKPAVKKP